MARDETNDELPGQDSFLDIVANMVGILIILVMVVGVRASHVASQQGSDSVGGRSSPAADVDGLKQELNAAVRQALDEKESIENTIARAVNLRRESELVDAQRLELATLQAAMETDIAERRSRLDAEKQDEFDVQRQIAEAKIELDKLTQERLSLLDEPTEVEPIESVPTPLAKEVNGEELHVRLKHGLLAIVPVKALLTEVERRGLDYLRRGLRENNSAADVYGPIDGFRLRLFLEVLTDGLPASSPLVGGPKRTMVQMGEFLPTADELGQPVERAMLPDSKLMQLLRAQRASQPALVVWVYPDSYSDLGTIKRAMWEQGVPLAVRPLDMDRRIIFSSHGTKSSAQ